MKNYAKIGGRKGRPAYRTPSSFKHRKHERVSRMRYLYTRYARYEGRVVREKSQVRAEEV